MIQMAPLLASAVLRTTETHHHKEKRLHKGGVGPEMRSPAGLVLAIMDTSTAMVNPVILDKAGGHA